jgi:hypothetical protein
MQDVSRSAVKFVENAAHLRAAHYRGEAARFCALAEREPQPNLRRVLRALAREYEKMAANLDVRRGRAIAPEKERPEGRP